MIPILMTLIDPWPGFQGRDIFHTECLRNGEASALGGKTSAPYGKVR